MGDEADEADADGPALPLLLSIVLRFFFPAFSCFFSALSFLLPPSCSSSFSCCCRRFLFSFFLSCCFLPFFFFASFDSPFAAFSF